MRFLKQSTSVDVPIGPFLDDTDGKTAETALTITQPDVRLKKNDAAWAQKNASQTLSHEENGFYEVTLDATDTNTLGRLRLAVFEAGSLPVWEDFMVMPANVWDALFGSDKLQVDAVEWLGGTIATPTVTGVPEVDLTHIAGAAVSTTSAQLGVNVVQVSGDGVAADNAEAFFDGTGYAGTGNTIPTVTTVNGLAANTITAAAIAADAITELRGAVASGTSDSGSTTTMVDSARTEADDDYWKGCFILFTSGTIAGQCRLITGFTASSDTMTFAPATTQAVSTQTYEILPAARVDLHAWLGTVVATPTVAGVPEVDLTHVEGTAHGSTQVRANVVQISGDATAADNLESYTDGTTPMPVNATQISSSATAADNVEANIPNLDATVSSRASQTSVDTIDDFLDTEIAAIKAKTDNLPSAVQKNTALNNFEFLMVSSTDHVTPATGLTITSQRSIDGGAFGNTTNSASEVANGIYKINLSAADLNGDVITLKMTATGADARYITILTEP